MNHLVDNFYELLFHSVYGRSIRTFIFALAIAMTVLLLLQNKLYELAARSSIFITFELANTLVMFAALALFSVVVKLTFLIYQNDKKRYFH